MKEALLHGRRLPPRVVQSVVCSRWKNVSVYLDEITLVDIKETVLVMLLFF